MRYHLLAAVTAGLSFTAATALAEDFSVGTLKAYNHASHVVTLNDGESFSILAYDHPNVKVGDKVIVDWRSNLNGDDHADYVGRVVAH